jgi:hypothetical protein
MADVQEPDVQQMELRQLGTVVRVLIREDAELPLEERNVDGEMGVPRGCPYHGWVGPFTSWKEMYLALVQNSDNVVRHHHLADPAVATVRRVVEAVGEVDPLRGGLPGPRERIHEVAAAETVLEEEHAAGGDAEVDAAPVDGRAVEGAVGEGEQGVVAAEEVG